MACQPHAGRAGRGGSERGGREGKFPKQNKPDTLPCKVGEVGACKDLEASPLTLVVEEKMKTCYVPPRRSLHFI
jgi:hypothetical protein